MKKTLLALAIFCGIASAILTPSKAKCQDPVTTAEVTKAVYDGVRLAASHWKELSWFFKGMSYTWWYARYEDGFTAYNNFRSYRTPNDAYNYFVTGHGDCDAVYIDAYGKEHHICYESPFQAKHYSQQHGPIVDIGFQGNNNQYRSVLNY